MNEVLSFTISKTDRMMAEVFPRWWVLTMASNARLDYADRHGGRYPSDAAVRNLERKIAKALGVEGEFARRKPPRTAPADHRRNTGHRDHGQQSQPPR